MGHESSLITVTRRNFIKLGSAGLVGAYFSLALKGSDAASHPLARAADVYLDLPGVTKAFSFVHLTDAHLTECDQRDAKFVERLQARSKGFGGDLLGKAEGVLEATRMERPDFVAFTGDLMDLPTAANLEASAGMLAACGAPCWITMGNHEWEWPAEPNDRKYWQGRLQFLANQPLDWFAKEFNGVNLVFVDNSDYQFTEDQLNRTVELLKDGRPCLLFIHIPIYIESLVPAVEQVWKMALMVGYEQGRVPPTPVTLEFCRVVKSHPAVAGIFAGHVHFEHRDAYRQGAVQYIGTPVFAGGMRKIFVRATA
ncbi:MAG: Metallophosphoesterase [Verrucomicrobia bacterium]|nr:Metallophosphoesterase [Verrucomicrobiota bacterium]